MVAHHYALPLKAQDTQSAGISQQMHSHWGQELASPLLCILNTSRSKEVERINHSSGSSLLISSKSGLASKTSSTLVFPNFFTTGHGILATERLMLTQILTSLDSSLSVLHCVICSLSQLPGSTTAGNGIVKFF